MIDGDGGIELAGAAQVVYFVVLPEQMDGVVAAVGADGAHVHEAQSSETYRIYSATVRLT